jgi:hypothetical protein
MAAYITAVYRHMNREAALIEAGVEWNGRTSCKPRTPSGWARLMVPAGGSFIQSDLTGVGRAAFRDREYAGRAHIRTRSGVFD